MTKLTPESLAILEPALYHNASLNFPVTDDNKFLADFESCRVPLAGWHHREHIKLAYLYLRLYPFDVAVDRVRNGIKALNAHENVPDLPARGYHETMTQAWMRLVNLT